MDGRPGRAPTDGYEAMAPFLYIRFCFTCKIFGPGFMYHPSQLRSIVINSQLLVIVKPFTSAQLSSLPSPCICHDQRTTREPRSSIPGRQITSKRCESYSLDTALYIISPRASKIRRSISLVSAVAITCIHIESRLPFSKQMKVPASKVLPIMIGVHPARAIAK